MAISHEKSVYNEQFLIEAIDGEGRRYCPSTQNAIEKIMKHLFCTAITVLKVSGLDSYRVLI